MRRHHTGSGRRQVIPADWSAHHRPVLDTTRDATVTLRRAGGVRGEFDPVTGTYPTVPYPSYFTGQARIQILPVTGQATESAEQDVTTSRYAVHLDHTVDGMQLGDECTVLAITDNGDLDLVDRTLIVEGIERGSLHWERRLVCVDNLETPATEGAGA